MMAQKNDLEARLLAFDYSGLEHKLSYSIVRHHHSFMGLDFKALAQISLFILGVYMTPQEKAVWLALSKVNVDMFHKHYTNSTFFSTGL